MRSVISLMLLAKEFSPEMILVALAFATFIDFLYRLAVDRGLTKIMAN